MVCRLGFLDLLYDNAEHPYLRQSERAPAVLPAFLALQDLDALAARQHVARTLQAVLAAKAFID